MDENTTGKLLPNLKITLGNDTDSDNLIEEGELSEIDESENGFSKTEKQQKNINIVRTWMKTLKNPKVYENKDGAFITGLDLSSEVLIKKLQDRAERFGLERKDEAITQKEIDALYKSLGIEPENLNSCKLKNIRLESLHMRGVEEMNTNEIFSYFGDFGPASVEWINDFSCNVVWLDASTTARAMIQMSQPFIIKKKASLNKDESSEVIAMSDSEESNDKKDDIVENAMETDVLSDTEKPDDLEAKSDSSEKVDVPVPPGHWRLGISHPKSKAILLRFATKDDKKLPGAEKRSQFYQKYGNPNYGGLKGIISSSRKRKIQAARNRQVVEKFAEDSTSQPDIHPGEASKRIMMKASRTKMPRMRMYADDEEEKKRTNSFMDHRSGHRSVHSRLGLKYTKNELAHLGNRFSSESEDDDDNISINCSVPSRFNVWTDIAKNMAEEDNYRRHSNSPDYEVIGPKRSQNSGMLAHNRRSPESTQGSRPWRPSRNESTEDLRTSLGSQTRQGPMNKTQEDLRSKIKRIKKEEAVQKHRSPMFMDD